MHPPFCSLNRRAICVAGGTYGAGLALVAHLVTGGSAPLCVAGVALARHRRAFCVAGVALMALGWLWWHAWFPVTPLHFVWQAWRLATSTCILRGRRGTCGTGLDLVARLVVWRRCRRGCLSGRRGAWWHRCAHTNFHTDLFHTQPWTHISFTQFFRTQPWTNTHIALSRKLQHTALSHATLSHTHKSFTSLNTQTSTRTHTHTAFTHTLLSHANGHTQLFHTQPFTRNSFTHNSFTHDSFTYNIVIVTHTTFPCHTHNLSHTALSCTQFFHTICLPPSPISFPMPLSHLFWACWKKLTCGVIRSFNFGPNPARA